MPFVERGGYRLHYDLLDAAPPWAPAPQTIVFHHGLSATLDLWNGWLPALATSHRIVRLDFVGHGGSKLEKPLRTTLDTLVDDLFAVADAAGAQRFHVVGESMGGTIAMAAAASRPERVASVTATNAAVYGGRVEEVRSWAAAVERDGQAAWAQKMMESRFFPGALDPARWQWFYDQHATCSMPTILHLAELLMATDIRDRLSRITMPALLISPDSSPFIAVDVMAEIHRAIAGSEMLVVPHSKHGLPFSHDAQCAAAFGDFLSRHHG